MNCKLKRDYYSKVIESASLQTYVRGPSVNYTKDKMPQRRCNTSWEIVYWPRRDAGIAKYGKWCRMCTQYKTTQTMQPMLPKDIPEGPCQDLATDLFKHNNTEYIIISETFSKYPFVYKTTSKIADTIIQKLKTLALQYGPPKRLSTDNGSPSL